MLGLRALTPYILLFLLLPAAARADVVDPAARPTTRFGPHYLLALDVSLRGIREPELSKVFAVDSGGLLRLTIGAMPIDPIGIQGATAPEAAERIKAAIRRYFTIEPEVRVTVARIPRIKITVTGAAFRNGPTTLVDGSHLSDALLEAGAQPSADLEHVKITRAQASGTPITLNPDLTRVVRGADGNPAESKDDPLLENGDQILIPISTAPVIPKTYAVYGQVAHPGFFPFIPGIAVREALQRAGDLLPTADPENVTIIRLTTRSPISLSAARANQNIPTDNLKLEPDDTILVARKDTGYRYAVVGSVVNPASFDFKGHPTLKQAIGDCGGFRPEADRKQIVLMRNALRDPAHTQPVVVDFDKIATGQQPDIPLDVGDMVQVQQRRKSQSPLIGIGLFLLRHFLPF